jgi:hypothetical protein
MNCGTGSSGKKSRINPPDARSVLGDLERFTEPARSPLPDALGPSALLLGFGSIGPRPRRAFHGLGPAANARSLIAYKQSSEIYLMII